MNAAPVLSESAADELSRLRAAVDAADRRLFEALAERAEAVQRIGVLKQGGPVFRPAREAAVLRGLLERARGNLPPEVIVHVWRGLFGAFCRMQGGLRAAYAGTADDSVRRDVIRNGFGTFIELTRCSGAAAVLNEAAADPTAVGILPLPVDGEPQPWWPALAADDRGLRIVGSLPCALGISPAFDSSPLMLVARVDIESSGDDFTLLTLSASDTHSRSGLQKIVTERLERAAVPLAVTEENRKRRLHLFRAEGFPADDLTERLSEFGLAKVIGVCPYPPLFTGGNI